MKAYCVPGKSREIEVCLQFYSYTAESHIGPAHLLVEQAVELILHRISSSTSFRHTFCIKDPDL